MPLEEAPAAAADDDDNANSYAVVCVGWMLMVFVCCPACCRSVTDIIL